MARFRVVYDYAELLSIQTGAGEFAERFTASGGRDVPAPEAWKPYLSASREVTAVCYVLARCSADGGTELDFLKLAKRRAFDFNRLRAAFDAGQEGFRLQHEAQEVERLGEGSSETEQGETS